MKYQIEFYRLDVESQEFEYLGNTTSYKGLSFANRLNDLGGATFQLNLLDSTCNARNLRKYVNQVAIKKGNTVQFFGPIVDIAGEYDEDGGYADIQCASYLYHLRSRYTDASKTYTGAEQSTIAWDLIDTVQGRDNGFLGIQEGTLTTTGVTRDRTYEYGRVSHLLVNLSNVINGLDFSFTPILDGNNKVTHVNFNTHYPLGSLRTDMAALQIGENIKLKNFKTQSPLHNKITGIGAGLVDPITSTAENTSLQKAIGRREHIIDKRDISIQDTLDERVNTYLNEESVDRLGVMISLYPDRTPALGEVGLGDRLNLDIEKGEFLKIKRDYRIIGIEVSVDINDAEVISLQFE